MESEFILESERESFIEQVREVIEMADDKGEGRKEGFPQVCLHHHLPVLLGSVLIRNLLTSASLHSTAAERTPTAARAVSANVARSVKL